RAPKLEHVAHPRRRHEAGENRPLDAPPAGLPLPPAPPRPPRHARHCAAEVQHSYLRPRLLLAPPPALQVRLHAEEPAGVLGGEVCCERRSRSANRTALAA